MKIFGAKAGLICLILFSASCVRAAVIVNNLNQPIQAYFGPIGTDNNTNDFLIAQQFTLPAGSTPFQLTDVTLLLSAQGGGGNITASIWSVQPNTNNPLNQIAVVASHLVASAGNVDFVPTNRILLAPGTYYIVTAPTTFADSGKVYWAFATTTNWVGSGALNNIADTSAGYWFNYSITNLPQQVSILAQSVQATLGISRTGLVSTLFWPSNLNGYVVQSATNVASSSWQTITNSPTTAGGTNLVKNISSNSASYYELRQSLVEDNTGQPNTDWDGPIGTDNSQNDFLIGQIFTLPPENYTNYTVNKITLSLNPAYGSARITASLWSVASGDVPGTEIAVVSSQVVNVPGNVSFVPAVPITLSSGSYYVVAAPTSSADNGLVGWNWTTSTAWTGFGTLGNFGSTINGSWQSSPFSTGPYQMSVQVTPTGN